MTNAFLLRLRCPDCHTPLAAVPDDCPGCRRSFTVTGGIIDMLPGGYNTDLRSRYEASAEMADPVDAVGYQSRRLYRLVCQAMGAAVFRHGRPGGRVLDVGCGHGALAAGLLPNFPVVGVDLARAMLALAQGRGLHAVQGDGTNLPFTDAQFDVAFSAEMIQHLAEAGALLSELARVVVPGGTVIISTLNRRSVLRRAFRLLRGCPTDAPLLRTAHELRQAGAACGLVPSATYWIFAPAPWIRRFDQSVPATEGLATNFIQVWLRPALPHP